MVVTSLSERDFQNKISQGIHEAFFNFYTQISKFAERNSADLNYHEKEKLIEVKNKLLSLADRRRKILSLY